MDKSTTKPRQFCVFLAKSTATIQVMLSRLGMSMLLVTILPNSKICSLQSFLNNFTPSPKSRPSGPRMLRVSSKDLELSLKSQSQPSCVVTDSQLLTSWSQALHSLCGETSTEFQSSIRFLRMKLSKAKCSLTTWTDSTKN